MQNYMVLVSHKGVGGKGTCRCRIILRATKEENVVGAYFNKERPNRIKMLTYTRVISKVPVTRPPKVRLCFRILTIQS